MDFKTFLEELSKCSPFNFCDYSENSIFRRIQKMQDDYSLTLEQMIDRVRTDSKFIDKIVDDITVNTTELFRDQEIWVSLYDKVYRSLKRHSVTTFWHVGCSSGQEVYANVILLNEIGLLNNCRVIGSDINVNMLEKARNGVYTYGFNSNYRDNFSEVMKRIGSKSKFEDYFEVDEKNDVIRVKDFIKNVPVFVQQDLVKQAAPFAYKVDVAFLRNVMIYFKDNLQAKVLNMVHEQMYQDGVLVMGKREVPPAQLKNRFMKNGMFYSKL